MRHRTLLSCFAAALVAASFIPASQGAPPQAPLVKIIFDTDMGNDVDDALALSILHALQTRGDCELLAVTITKPDELAVPFVDVMNTFYGRPNIPLGFTRSTTVTNEPSRYLSVVNAEDGGKLRYPHAVKHSLDVPPAAELLRAVLSRQPDGSVVFVQTGFFSNLAALLDTPGDAVSPLTGVELVKRKVRYLSVMAGAFKTIGDNNHFREYNVINDIPAAQKVARDWPSPIFWSGFEIGIAIPYPAISIERDFSYVAHHPAAEAYYLYKPPPHNRPTWDLTSTLYAVLPDRDYFTLSTPGRVTVEDDGFTRFAPAKDGRDRYLVVDDAQAVRIKEAFVQLASEPPPAFRPH